MVVFQVVDYGQVVVGVVGSGFYDGIFGFDKFFVFCLFDYK